MVYSYGRKRTSAYFNFRGFCQLINFYAANHKNYNFLNCDWFKKLLFSTNSLVKLLSDSLFSDSLLSDSGRPILLSLV